MILKQYLGTVVLALILGTLIRLFLLQTYQISNSNMQPNVLKGDLIFVAQWPVSFQYSNFPQRGDVVIYTTETESSLSLKRVLGIPGDHIQSKDGILYLNDQKLSDASSKGCFEETLGSKTYCICRETSPIQNFEPQEVFKDFLFVIDDFRVEALKTSHYSTWAMIPQSSVKGRALIRWLSLKNREKTPGPSFLRLDKMLQRIR